ncbi:MAG: LPP20 family lipoprotein [Fibrobacteria bacterium]|nr:LPP20 family lipoprotein [Fibrobacteria bacterium]
MIIKKILICTFFLAITGFIGCAGGVKGQKGGDDLLAKLNDAKNKLKDEGIIAEVATATSQDLQTAINKVELEARAMLTRSLETKSSSLQKSFKEEVGEEYLDHFSQVTKNVSSKVLRGTTLRDTPYRKNDGKYEVFGLMVMDPKVFADAMAAEMAANEAMKTRWLASKAYKELDQEIKAFEQFKDKNTPGAN